MFGEGVFEDVIRLKWRREGGILVLSDWCFVRGNLGIREGIRGVRV